MSPHMIQCICGLCFENWDVWANHRQDTQHAQQREITFEQLTKEATHAIKGLSSILEGIFKKI